MKRHLTTALIAFTLLATAAPAGAQTGNPPPPPLPSARVSETGGKGSPTPGQLGRLEGTTYTNDFFGVSFDVPPGWVAQDAAMKQRILDKGKEIVGTGADSNKTAVIESSLQRTYFLLSVSKYDLNTPPPGFNAVIMCMAERVPTAVIKTGDDYIASMIRMTEGTAAKIELRGPVRTEKVGGVSFATADARLTTPSAAAAQKYYVMVRNGYAFILGYTYVDEEDLKAFSEVVKTVKFK